MGMGVRRGLFRFGPGGEGGGARGGRGGGTGRGRKKTKEKRREGQELDREVVAGAIPRGVWMCPPEGRPPEGPGPGDPPARCRCMNVGDPGGGPEGAA